MQFNEKEKVLQLFFGEWARKRGGLFGSLFKQQEGLTPRQYRLQQRQLGKNSRSPPPVLPAGGFSVCE